MKNSDAFVDLVHLAASLVDPRGEADSGDRLRTALPAALGAIGNAPIEQVIEFVKSARAAGVRFKGTDEEVAQALKARTKSSPDGG